MKNEWQTKWLNLEVTVPKVQELADEIEAFAKRWFCRLPKPGLLVLAGPPGIGKTHVAKAIHKWAGHVAVAAWEKTYWKDKVPNSLFLSWPEVTDGFKEGRYEILADCFSTDLLVLDDVGAEHDPSRNAADKLCQILSQRAEAFTLITTNIAPEGWAQKFDARIEDRMYRNSIVMDLSEIKSYSTT